jgi:predicted ATPase/DNA-binding SARP family transcriptional activator
MGRSSPVHVADVPCRGCDTVESADADSTGARQVRIRLLGEVGAESDRGDRMDVGPAKCQAVLAALALSAGTPVPVWRLVDVVWGEDPPRTAERTLQSYLTRLRKSLGPGSVVRTGAAYRLDVPADCVDALRFQRLLDAGDAEAALAEWTGLPLTGLSVPGLAATVDGLVERWLGAVEADLERRVEAGATSAIGPLTELTASYPFREGLWALLMTALYRAGRQADALAAYRTARQHLADQLGVEPGPRLRELEALVLGHDERLGTGLKETGPRAGDDARGNLPRRQGRLIGRDEDLKALGDALATWPVVTLVGPGGIGKTRLALAAARQVVADDGAWLIDLAEIASPAGVPRAVAGPLGIKESPGRPLGQAIVTALRSRQLLLVLDNCEHVIDAVAGLAQAIAEGCPDVQVLATSREGLGLDPGLERLMVVAPLEPSGPGAELFSERAEAVSASFDPQASRQDVEEICRRLDGVPLAIELAAARTASLAPADLLRRLGDHLRLLVGGRRTGAERHRTLRATIGWSYDLLSPAERLLFSRLSIFVGPFDLAAAETVAADAATGAADVDDLLGNLVARSMVVAEPGPFGRRFRLLETMRQFAAEQLAGSGGTGAVAQRHARWCLDRVTHIGLLLAGPGEIEGVARLGELAPNHRAAFEWACASGDRHLAHALVRPVVAEVVLRSRGELGDWVERILAMTTPDDTELVVFGLSWAAQRYKMGQEPDAWERLARRYGEPDDPRIRHARAAVYQDWAAVGRSAPAAIAELRGRGDDDLAEQMELDGAAPLVFAGQFEQGDARIEALASRYRAHGPPTLLHLSLALLGFSARLQGKHERAEQLFGEAVAVVVPEGTQSPDKSVEARAVFRRGETSRACRILGAHIDELLDAGNIMAICVTCAEFVNMMAALDRLEDAARMLHHLDKTAPYWAGLVAEARRKVAAGVPGGLAQASDLDLDDRQALEYMRRVLRQLAHGQPTG